MKYYIRYKYKGQVYITDSTNYCDINSSHFRDCIAQAISAHMRANGFDDKFAVNGITIYKSNLDPNNYIAQYDAQTLFNEENENNKFL